MRRLAKNDLIPHAWSFEGDGRDGEVWVVHLRMGAPDSYVLSQSEALALAAELVQAVDDAKAGVLRRGRRGPG